jgi:hypothetical protein
MREDFVYEIFLEKKLFHVFQNTFPYGQSMILKLTAKTVISKKSLVFCFLLFHTRLLQNSLSEDKKWFLMCILGCIMVSLSFFIIKYHKKPKTMSFT